METRTDKKKKAFLKAFAANNGLQQEACRLAKVSRMTVTRWRNNDHEFANNYDSVTDQMLQMLHGIDKSKELLMASVLRHNGNITMACISLGMSRQTHRKWYKEDIEYRDRIDDILEEVNEGLLDVAIEKWKKLIEEEDFKAIKLAIDKIGTNRGFIDKKQHEITTPKWMSGDKELDEI